MTHSALAPRRGFTLVEVLIALAILAVIGVLAYRAMAALADGEARLAVETSRWTTLDAVFVRLESDLRAAVPRAVRHGTAREPAFVADVDGAGNALFTLTRAGSEFDDEPGRAGQRVSYAARDGTLTIAYWPALDNVAGATPTTYPLLGDVAQFHVGYETSDGRFIAQWPVLGEPDVPRAVRIELLLADGVHVERWFALQ
ncbi:MAG TPA: type II secretion system minor pseudopilin GspJ [Casimicrobiaceae bacterium]|nr:type II secretion system minor pseudopilin GspJ [Casimicrobiaceae bacterium]